MIKFGSANPHLPSSYTLIHEMATGTGVYKVHTVLFMTILFGGWTLLLFVLASVNRQMLWQKVRYR